MTTITGVRPVNLDAKTTGEPVDVEFSDAITAIRPVGAVAPAGDVVDGHGRFLLPGLIDTHVHLGSHDALVSAIRAGVTTLIDLGTHPDSLIAEQRAGHGVPAVVSAGSAASAPGSNQIAQMGFPDESGVNDPNDADRYLDWRIENGSELIKIIVEDPAATQVPALDVPTIAALVEGAHRRGLRTVAHVVTAAAFDRGLDAGVDILTHAPLDRPLPGATVQRMVDAGTIASPTLVMMQTVARARYGDQADNAFHNALQSVTALHDAGVYIIAGTDANETQMAPVPHGTSLHDETDYLQRAGMTAAEALRAATSAAAAAFGLDDRGRLAEGLRADLLLVDGDPVANPAGIRQPAGVWVAGRPSDDR
jgi:imidazolonepropionase-like amidohydrolase